MIREDEKSLTFHCLKVTQPIGDFYIASIPAKELVKITYFDVRRVLMEERDVERYLGVQRPLNPGRVKDISAYVQTSDACFPTGIIIAVPRSGPHRLGSDWTMISAFLHHEQQAQERSNETKETYPFT